MNPSEFAKRVVYLMERRESVLANKVNVEDWVPTNLNPKGKASYLFFLTQLDYAIKSTLLYEGSLRLYAIKPDFFLAKTIVDMPGEELLNLLVTYLRPRYANEAVFRYIANSKKLLDDYKGDPRNIFSTGDAPAVLKKIWEFRGFGPKTGNLFFRSMVTTFDIKLVNLESVLPPVDIHDVRIAKLMGFVESDQMTTKNVLLVKEMWSKACKDAGVNWLVFDKALWLLGSIGKPSNREDILKLLGF